MNNHIVQSIAGTEIWLDPTEKEMQLSNGCLVLSCMPALGTVTSLWQSGQMKPNEVLEVSHNNSRLSAGVLIIDTR